MMQLIINQENYCQLDSTSHIGNNCVLEKCRKLLSHCLHCSLGFDGNIMR
jgi:hypothetical protein